MTQKEREIFYRLLVDLFTDNPKRRQPQAEEGKENNESISASQRERETKPNTRQAATSE